MKITRLISIVLSLQLLTQAFHAFGNVASPAPFHVRQPEGTELTLRVRGDEWFHWYETLDGRAVVMDPSTRFWVYLTPSQPGTNVLSSQRVGIDRPVAPPWQPRPSAAQLSQRKVWRSVFTSPKSRLKTVASRGTGLMPVLLGNFADTTPTVSVSTMSNLLFDTSPGAKSMSTYYREVSYGQFTVAAGPSGIQNWVTVPNAAAYYGATNPAVANAVDIRAPQFVRDVVVAAIAAGYDFSPYDLDRDGKVDVVCVVHAGIGEDYGGGPNAIWSHRSSLSAGLGTNGPVVVQTANGPLVIDDYIIEPEVQPKPGGVGVDPIGIGVFCHEYGHALGLPDLYDPTYGSFGVGNWSVMSYGSHNGLAKDGDCPPHFDAWCKARLGWLQPVNYTLDYQDVPFPATAQTAFAARLWKDGLAGPQYYLLENRYRTNFDAALPASGLLIWHIDDSKGVLNDNKDNTQPWYPAAGSAAANTNNGNYHVALVQADQLWELETKANTGNPGDPFPGSANNRVFGPGTSPNSYAYNNGLTPGYNSFVTVSNISDPGPVMTADLYTRSPNSGPAVDWVNIGGVVPPASGAQFVQLDAYHPLVIRAFPGISGNALRQVQLYLSRAADGRWWDFSSQQWGTNAVSSNYSVQTAQQYGLTLAFESGLPAGTNLVNGGYDFIVRVIDSLGVVTELQMAMTAAHAPEVNLSLADNAVVNTLTNFTAIASENSGLGVQRVEVALYWDGAATEGSPSVRWYWSGTSWTTTPLWLGADFQGHPAQATLYYPIGPDAPNLLTEKQYTIAARATDALGDTATNTISVFYDPGSAATIYWRYAADGNWFDPANWNPSRVPTGNDHAVVNAPGDYTVTVPAGASVASLRFGRVVGLGRQHLSIPAGGTLTISGSDTNHCYANATLDLGGTLNAPLIRFSGGSTWTWTNGALSGSAELGPGSLLAIRGGDSKLLGDGTSLVNSGAIVWAGGGPLLANGYSGPSWITNLTGGVFQLQGDGELFGRVNGSHEMIFVNAGGAFWKVAGTNTLVDTCGFWNSSVVRADTGTLSFNADLQLKAGGTFTGAGTHRVLGGSVGVSGVTTVADSVLELAAAQVQGASDNSGVFATTGSGRLVWSGGTLLAGVVGLAANSQAEISGNDSKLFLDGAVLENYGRITWSAGSLLANGYSDRSFIRNQAGGLFTVTGTNTAARVNGSHFGEFDNLPGATLVLDDPAESPWTSWQLVNDGTFLGTRGSLRLDAGGASSGVFSNAAGAELRFSGGTFALHAGTQFIGSGTTRVAGATLTADGYAAAEASASDGWFELDSGAITGAGFTSLGQFRWTGGAIGGTFSNAPAAMLTMAGPAACLLNDGAVVNNTGLARLSGGSLTINGYSAVSTWNNLPGARFEITQDGSVFGRVNGSYTLVFNNGSGARLAKTAGTNTVLDTCTFNNTGELRGDSGTLSFAAILNLNPGGVFTGVGRHELLGGSVAWSGTNVLEGTTLNLSGASVTGMTNATIVTTGNGLFDWTGGSLSATMTLAAGSQLQLSGSGPKVLADGAVFNNGGTALFNGRGLLSANGYSADSTWNNLAGSHFDITSDGGLFGRNNGSHLLVFNNQSGARFAKLAGTNSLVDTCVFNNAAELRNDGGILEFNGTVNLNPGGVLTGTGRHEVIGGSVSWSGTNSIEGTTLTLSAGGLTGLTNATIATAGGWFDWAGGALTGTLELAAGSQMHLSGAGGRVLMDGAIFNNAGLALVTGTGKLIANGYSAPSLWNNLAGAHFDIQTDGPVFGQANGSYGLDFNNYSGARLAKTAGTNSVIDSGVVSNEGELRSDSGMLAFSSILNLNNGGVFTGAGSHWLPAGRVTLTGTTTVQATTVTDNGCALVGGNAATLATAAGGFFDWSAGSLAGTLNFAGASSVRFSGTGAKTLADGAVINNSGTVDLLGIGPLQANGYSAVSTFNNLPGGVIHVLAAAVWNRINGSYRGVLNNSGTILLNNTPQLFQADWDFNQASSGLLGFLVAGPTPGTQFSQANFTGNASLNGTVAVSFANGYTATNSQSFALLNSGSLAGRFALEQLPPVALPLLWKTTYGPTAYTLNLAPLQAALNPVATTGAGSDTFQFDLSGPAATSAIVWTMLSGDPQGWRAIYTNSPFTGLVHFTDVSEPPLPAGQARFYKIQFEGVAPNLRLNLLPSAESAAAISAKSAPPILQSR